VDRKAERGMKIGRRGKDLAVQIPVALVRQLDLKKGDEVDVTARDGVLYIGRIGCLGSVPPPR